MCRYCGGCGIATARWMSSRLGGWGKGSAPAAQEDSRRCGHARACTHSGSALAAPERDLRKPLLAGERTDAELPECCTTAQGESGPIRRGGPGACRVRQDPPEAPLPAGEAWVDLHAAQQHGRLTPSSACRACRPAPPRSWISLGIARFPCVTLHYTHYRQRIHGKAYFLLAGSPKIEKAGCKLRAATVLH